ncbi:MULTISPECIES: hypothetical protein [unclassified Streptomyces]|jgi:hypothetical protein|uniref:AG2 protein n=1 Tax=Streptomyces thermocoprophilus TaxID=78356 RepID=A0ABV5VHS8_9ACTN
MNFETLRDADFGKLDQAITAWEDMIKKLEELKNEARDDMKAKSDRANWAGVNAAVSRQFITKTAGEFADAHAQATSIYNILKDTRGELASYKKQLVEATERGRKKNLTVTPTGGGGFTVTMIIHPDRAAEGTTVPDHSPRDAEELRDDVQRILNRATESDSTAAKVLKAIADQAQIGFADVEYRDRDTAAEAVKKAEEAAKIIKEKGDEMSPEEFRKLNGLLASYKNDPLFQEQFATQVGAEGFMKFWADLSSPDSPNDLVRTQLNQLGDFQKNLGHVLGGATLSDSPAMRQWENDMVRLGSERFHSRTGDSYGFQILANVMRTGEWDGQFLNRWGNDLVAHEKKMKIPGHYYQMQPAPRLNFIGNEDFGRDPVTGLATALRNNPGAATQFFNTTEPQDNAAWLLKERPYFDDSPLTDGPNEAREAVGKAMFAAVSGVSDSTDPDIVNQPHTDDQRRAMKRALEHLAATGDDFPPEFREPMAYAMGNHGDQVHMAMSSPLVEHDLDASQLMEVSKQISRNRDAYQILTQVMHQPIMADIYNEKAHPEDSLDRAGRTIGFLEEARYQATESDKGKELADASWRKAWRYHIVGGIVGPWAPPLDWAQRAVDMATSNMLEDEQARIEDAAAVKNQSTYQKRRGELQAIADIWYEQNKEWAEDPAHEGYSGQHGVYKQIDESANDGNKKAQGVSGSQ